MSKSQKYQCPNCEKKIELFLNVIDKPRCTRCGIKMILKNPQVEPVATVPKVDNAKQPSLF